MQAGRADEGARLAHPCCGLGGYAGKELAHGSRNERETRRCQCRLADHHLTSVTADAAAITAVAAQPKIISGARSVKRPMISRREATSIIATMIGTAQMPFSTALQNSALIGSMLRPVDQDPHEGRGDDDRIEARGLPRLELEPFLPPEDLGRPRTPPNRPAPARRGGRCR